MRSAELAVTGAFVFTAEVFPDDRGLFVSPMQQPALLAAVGLPVFPSAQVSYSSSREGVVRGVHYTLTPPGGSKYSYVPYGRALDFVVDIRVGSPTYGCWDSVILDAEHARAVYLPVGVGHAFVSLADNTIMSYLLSQRYDAGNEAAVSLFDTDLALPLPDTDPILSARDRAAPTLAEAAAAGLLPDYTTCRELVGSRS
jgi:epimerase EvaD